MVLPGINLDKNLPGYDFAKMSGVGAADFDFKALGAAMDCHREFAHAGIIYSDGPSTLPGSTRQTTSSRAKWNSNACYCE